MAAILSVAKSNLSHDALNSFFDESQFFLEADCFGDDPKVECPSCAACYDYAEGRRVINVPKSCELDIPHKVDVNARGAVCHCVPTHDRSGNVTAEMMCSESCQSCTRDGKVCAVNVDYGYTYDWRSNINGTHSTFQYVKGLNDTVVFQNTFDEEAVRECTVTINGKQCRHCAGMRCLDSWEGYRVWCDNIEGVGNFNHCTGGSESVGPLAIFQMQEDGTTGCSPFLPLI